MKTSLVYLENSYKFQEISIVLSTSRDEVGNYVILNKTIFYPQGGGQPSDTGSIYLDGLEIPIILVKMLGNEVRHYTKDSLIGSEGKETTIKIHHEKRLLHSKLHTAGHLISNITEQYNPNYQTTKGHHWPDHSYVEFVTKDSSNNLISIDKINELIKEAIKLNHAIKHQEIRNEELKKFCPNINFNFPLNETLRIVSIGNYPFSPCGGTHVQTLKELSGLQVTKVKAKNNNFRITYNIY